MSRVPLAFRAVGVRRMPGISDGGWELAELSPGVNVVWGPNGAGKTTTARAMEHLLWPSSVRAGRPVLDGRVALAGEEWRLELDGTLRCQRSGADAAFVPLPPATERDRYHLSLHELLNDRDQRLAEVILHESAGGFDVAGAAEALEFRRAARPSTRERAALDQARARAAAAREEEAGLRDEEAELAGLRATLAAHDRGAARRTLLERALERLDAAGVERAARAALDRFPAELAALQGDEAGRLRTLRHALAGAHDRARAATRDIEAARRSLAGTELPGDGLPGDILPRISAALTRLQKLEETALRLDRELERAREECRAERASVAGAVGDDHVAALTLPAVEELMAFARAAEEHRAQVRAAEAELAWLAGDAPAADLDALRRGRDLLAAWLREPGEGAPARARTVALAAAALLALAGVALALFHPAGWALVAVAAVLGWAAWSARGDAGRRAQRRKEYERQRLDPPARWEADEVVGLVERLESRIAEARLHELRADRRAAAGRKRAELEVGADAIARRRAELAGRIGLAPDADEGAVAWLGQRVHRWQVASVAVQQAEAELARAREQQARASAELEGWIAPYAGAVVSSAAEVAGTLDHLRGRQQSHAEASLRLASGEKSRGEAEDEAARLRAECASLLARAGLPEDADRRMDELCAEHRAFVAAREQSVGARQVLGDAERRLAETPGCDDALRELPRADARAALAACLEAAAEAERLREAVFRLEERLRAARARTEVGDAVAQVHDAGSALRECRGRDEAAAAGWTLKEFVERETRDRDRPAVFHRARKLFAAITRGRYRLELSDATPPEFRAVDSTTGAGCGLDDLSRGSRVQLLLAVRIAFIETMESGVRLPLVLDEALGNSDDLRAGAVMDAVIELARGGRQVFFLTARRDEAERWMARLGAAGVAHALVDLAEARRTGRFAELPRAAAASHRIGAVPPPGEMDHAAYGAALRVPPVDAEGGPDGVHLWYLVDDPAALHRLLVLGAETWGGLRTLVDAVGPAFLGPDETGYTRLRALGRALECLLESRRIGRGRRVDRDALERSGAISDRFMERVEELRQQCAGRPGDLLAAVELLPRFRAEARAALRDFLEREGYIDPRDPLDEVRIRTGLLVALAPDLREGHCTTGDVERMLAMVPAGA